MGVNGETYANDVQFGKRIHMHVVKSGWGCNLYLGSALVYLYSKTMVVDDARKVFNEMPVPNTVWMNGIELFRSIPGLNLSHDNWTYIVTLSICGGIYANDLGSQIHTISIRTLCDLQTDVFLLSSLIDLYGKCGMVRFTELVLWTSMLGGIWASSRSHTIVQTNVEEEDQTRWGGICCCHLSLWSH
ncbi:hypothetical protein QVD17_18205 [Tagetes erecta]|uniref:Pentatricopeptide repeat-containing protein n=1 Tax=Tagetes erecta TaxID=13708 RepID=A0AAD8KK71_TARER|nr:hypothetical protein QVD17_18205 [Tagetes erecta]